VCEREKKTQNRPHVPRTRSFQRNRITMSNKVDLKVVILGKSGKVLSVLMRNSDSVGIGKTCLIKRYVNGSFDGEHEVSVSLY
jgi:hypothetical protein